MALRMRRSSPRLPALQCEAWQRLRALSAISRGFTTAVGMTEMAGTFVVMRIQPFRSVLASPGRSIAEQCFDSAISVRESNNRHCIVALHAYAHQRSDLGKPLVQTSNVKSDRTDRSTPASPPSANQI